MVISKSPSTTRPPEKPATPPRTEGGQPCSKAGYWSTPAQQQSWRLFALGEIMPVIEGSSWGHTFWYWSSEK
ncbi:hypothetical protein D9M69_726130 [compost metagenome]